MGPVATSLALLCLYSLGVCVPSGTANASPTQTCYVLDSLPEPEPVLDLGPRAPLDGATGRAHVVDSDNMCFSFVECTKCSTMLVYDSKKTGTSTLERHMAKACHGKKDASPPEVKKTRGDVPDILPEPEPEPTSPVSDYENSYNYVLSRLAGMDQAIHKLNVGHYTLDVKVSQLMDRLIRMDAKVGELEDNIREVYQHSKDNRKEIGRLEACQKGHRMGYKCYLVYNSHEDYAGASRKCMERGGRMAMPRDRREQEALADYVKSFFHPGNWPVWLGINDLRSEGMYLFDDGTRVSYFQWRKHFLSSQPDGGKRENCVAMSSDDGDWWDHYCDRTMNYLCEFDDRVAL